MCFKVPLRLTGLLLVLLTPLQSFAESVQTNLVKSEQSSLWKKVEDAGRRVEQLFQHSTDVNSIEALFSSDCNALPSPEQHSAAALSAKADALKNDKGLELRAGYTTANLGDNLSDEDDRSYLELNWNVLSEGYQARQDKTVALVNRAEAARLRGEQKHFKRKNRCRQLSISNSFANLQSALLLAKLDLMIPVLEVERRAYFMGWSFLDDLLVSEGDLHSIRQSLKLLNQSELTDRDHLLMDSLNQPIIELNLATIIRAIQSDDRDLKIRHAERQVARYEAKAAGQKDRLRLFVRKSFSNDTNGVAEEDLAAGIRYTMPFSGQPQTVLDHELKSIDASNEVASWQRVARTRAAYIAFQEQHTRVTSQQFRFLRAAERLRRSIVVRDVSKASTGITTAILRVRTLLDASLELVKAKQTLYQRINEVLYQAELAFDHSFIRLTSLPDQKYRARPVNRALYIWSASFNQYDDKRLWHFLETKGVRSVMLSAGRKIDKNKLNLFLARAKEKSVDVGLMIGASEWIFERNWEQALQRSAVIVERTGHLHLDIEPHTLPEYKTNRRQYLDAYYKLITSIRKVMAPGDKLSLSVPLHWDIEDYVKLNGVADELYLMAYETADFSKLARRLAPILEVLPAERITIALRPQDFANEWALEQMITKIANRFGIRQVALHDIKTYLALPKAEK